MLCVGYLQGVYIGATPDPLSLSLKLCSRMSKGLSLGVLMAIISRSDRQLLRNKNELLHYVPCIFLFNSNMFHKFWMSCACRRSHPKIGRKWRKPRRPGLDYAGRPDTSTCMGTSLLQEQRDMFTMPQN